MVIERYRSVLSARGGQGAEISLFVARRTRTTVVFLRRFRLFEAQMGRVSREILFGVKPSRAETREILVE
jgi:hypothetical protein